MTNHRYIGITADDTGQWRAVCKCGHKSQPSVVKTTAQKRLLDHVASGDAKDARRAHAVRVKAGKKAYATRKRNAR